MQEVTVSVIMPAYNSEAYIRESIDSVLGQSFTDFELVVVDDGSTDSTAQIVESYTDSRIRLIRQPENRALARSMIRRGMPQCSAQSATPLVPLSSLPTAWNTPSIPFVCR